MFTNTGSFCTDVNVVWVSWEQFVVPLALLIPNDFAEVLAAGLHLKKGKCKAFMVLTASL